MAAGRNGFAFKAISFNGRLKRNCGLGSFFPEAMLIIILSPRILFVFSKSRPTNDKVLCAVEGVYYTWVEQFFTANFLKFWQKCLTHRDMHFQHR